MDIKKIIEKLVDPFLKAGDLSISLREKGLKKQIKSDNTPVSNGDLEVNKFITKNISDITPDIPIISEETSDNKDNTQLINLLTSRSPLLTGVLSGFISFFRPFSLRDIDISPAFKKGSTNFSIIFFMSI